MKWMILLLLTSPLLAGEYKYEFYINKKRGYYIYHIPDGEGGQYCIFTKSAPDERGLPPDPDLIDTNGVALFDPPDDAKCDCCTHRDCKEHACVFDEIPPGAKAQINALREKYAVKSSPRPETQPQPQPAHEQVEVKQEPIPQHDDHMDDPEYDILWTELYGWEVWNYFATKDARPEHDYFGPHWERRSPNSRAEWFRYFYPKLPWTKIKAECQAKIDEAEAQRKWDRDHPADPYGAEGN